MTSQLHAPDEVQRMLSVLGSRAKRNLSFHDLDKIRRVLNPPLKYSAEPPTLENEGDWFWYLHEPGGRAVAAEVQVRETDGKKWVRFLGASVGHLTGQFAGPISQPDPKP